MARASKPSVARSALARGGLSAALLLPTLAHAGSTTQVPAAGPGAALLWLAVWLAAGTALAWALRRPPAQARWPSLGFGLALLAATAGMVLQLAADLGSGHSALQIRFGRHTADAAGRPCSAR